MNRHALAAGLFAALGAFSPAIASAGTVEGRYVENARGFFVNISLDQGGGNVFEQTTFAGQLRHTFSNGTGLGAMFDGVLICFCAEADQDVALTPTPFDVVDSMFAPSSAPMGEWRAQAVDTLWSFAGGQQFDTSTSNSMFACAFQIAIWECVYDWNPNIGGPSLDIQHGKFKVTTTNPTFIANLQAQLGPMFAAIAGNPEPMRQVLGLVNPNRQDLLAMPEPSVLAMVGVGLVGACRRRREV